MKILGVAGSLRSESYAFKALELAMRKIEALGCQSELLDLRKLNLPFCDGSAEYPNNPDVNLLREKFISAQGIILSAPEYHGSVSGVLKNTLDLLDFQHVEGKVFAIISVLGGEYSTNALSAVRIVCRHLHAWVIPEQVVIPYSHTAFDVKGELVDPQLQRRLDTLIEQLVKYTKKLHHN